MDATHTPEHVLLLPLPSNLSFPPPPYHHQSFYYIKSFANSHPVGPGPTAIMQYIEGGGKLTREHEHTVIVIIIAMVHITFASNFSQKMGKGMSHIMCYCSLFSEIPENQNQP